MIWMRRKFKKRLISKERVKEGWHTWFAWYPVWAKRAGATDEDSYDYWAWFEPIERKWVPPNKWDITDEGYWAHRLLPKEEK